MLPQRTRPIDYGRGTHTIEAPVADAGVLSRLSATLRSPKYEPPLLPVAALELLDLTRRAHTTFRDVLDLMESDQLIAARVLRVAQSPIYTRGEPVRTLEQALSRLGMSTLAQIFLQVSLTSKVFRAPGYEGPMEQLRKHAIAVAHASRLVARQTSLHDEVAFLCGLLHDIGAVVSLIVLTEGRGSAPPPFARIKRSVDEVHSEASSIVAQAWMLPADVRLALEHHHMPLIRQMAHPLSCVVLLADELASSGGVPSPLESVGSVELAKSSLDISDATWRRLVDDFGPIAASFR